MKPFALLEVTIEINTQHFKYPQQINLFPLAYSLSPIWSSCPIKEKFESGLLAYFHINSRGKGESSEGKGVSGFPGKGYCWRG